MKHTPGPWKFASDQHSDYQHAIAAENGKHVGAAYHNHPCRMTAEEKANARLIAAAPELLEACETALTNLSPLYASDHLVIRRLTAAIKKTKGE